MNMPRLHARWSGVLMPHVVDVVEGQVPRSGNRSGEQFPGIVSNPVTLPTTTTTDVQRTGPY